MTDDPVDFWRLAEWNALQDICLVKGCDGTSGIDLRGPVWLIDGSIHKACTDHWEGIIGVLGRQSVSGMTQ